MNYYWELILQYFTVFFKWNILSLLQGFLSLAYLSLSGNVFTLINYIQIVYWLAIGCAIAALFWLRKTMPNAERPIKVDFILFFLKDHQ